MPPFRLVIQLLKWILQNLPANRASSPLNVKLNIRARRQVIIFRFPNQIHHTDCSNFKQLVSFQSPRGDRGQRCGPVMQGHRRQDNHTFFFLFSAFAFPRSTGECGSPATAPIHHSLLFFDRDHHPPCFPFVRCARQETPTSSFPR